MYDILYSIIRDWSGAHNPTCPRGFWKWNLQVANRAESIFFRRFPPSFDVSPFLQEFRFIREITSKVFFASAVAKIDSFPGKLAKFL